MSLEANLTSFLGEIRTRVASGWPDVKFSLEDPRAIVASPSARVLLTGLAIEPQTVTTDRAMATVVIGGSWPLEESMMASKVTKGCALRLALLGSAFTDAYMPQVTSIDYSVEDAQDGFYQVVVTLTAMLDAPRS